ncbi:MAG: glycosyltransferase family 4 protein [Dysgonamonadaceae bacterium]
MKVAFYISNRNISSIDTSLVDKGNPGIGGSEYSVILISSLLSRNKDLEVVLLCDEIGIFPKHLKYVKCNNLIGAIQYYVKNDFDFLVVDSKLLLKHIVQRFYNVRFLAWANCFISDSLLDFYSKQSNVYKIINVGKEQYYLTKDKSVYNKSCFIYNAVPITVLNDYKGKLIPNGKREKNVVYVGSLILSKGFHLLAQAWPKVINKIPEARLYVIGSGKLYSRNSKLGKWGIANEIYESRFMQYLAPNGKLMDSVKFLGILGTEKYDILSQCKVGVPNPSGLSETFGYTAVEMQFMDCLVTTIKCPGYLDTVYDKENLYNSPDELSTYIIELLNSSTDVYPQVMEYINRFSVDEIVLEWEKLFEDLALKKRVNHIDNYILFTNGFMIYYLRYAWEYFFRVKLKAIYNFFRRNILKVSS